MQSSSRFGLENVMKPRSAIVVGAGLWLAGAALGGAALAHEAPPPVTYEAIQPAETPAITGAQVCESATTSADESNMSTDESTADESAALPPEMALPEDEVVAARLPASGVTEMQSQ